MAFGHFSFGLSQLHGHGSWLVCEVALIAHSHLLVWVISERRVSTFSGSQWLQPVALNG
jgi:hypothetical protein